MQTRNPTNNASLWLADLIAWVYSSGTKRCPIAHSATTSSSWRTTLGVAVLGVLSLLVLVKVCRAVPPRNIDDLCAMFEQRKSWREATASSQERWGVPEPIQLAILHQESRFRPTVRPGWRTVFWIIPVGRLSSAYGYGQVKDGTWQDYQKKTGNTDGKRSSFADVTDFIGWYGQVIHRVTGVALDDAYHFYLAYHEGPSGFARGSYAEKEWLQGVARKVEARAGLYAAQFATCGGPALP
ncbi:MAG: hypothetical protein GY723_09140 [bacterium]|nr:hypothetical protein [bacterium]